MTLFELTPVYPSGFQYYPEFISMEEEEELIAVIQSMNLPPMVFQGYEAKRRTASFGWDWHFDTRQLTKGEEMPPAFDGLKQKLAQKFHLHADAIAELLLTAYPPGSMINWHRDAPPFEMIMGISLQADAVFRLRLYNKIRQGKKNIISFPIERRSLYLISGESRKEWEHSIAPVKDWRYSITWRTLRQKV